MGSSNCCTNTKNPVKPPKNPNKFNYNNVILQLIDADIWNDTSEAIVNSCEKPYSPNASFIIKRAGDDL